MKRPWCDGLLGAALVCSLAVGCGQRGPAVNVVEGIVKLDGEPVAEATVFFTPAAGSAGVPAAGQTGPDGRFRLTSVGAKSGGGGAVEGTYVVTVTKVDSGLPPLPTSTDDPNYGKFPAPPGPNEKPKIKFLVPQEYGDAKTSPLKATVSKGANQGDGFTFELKSTP